MRYKHNFTKYPGPSCIRCGLKMKTILICKEELHIKYGKLNNKQIAKLVYKEYSCITDDEYTIKNLLE